MLGAEVGRRNAGEHPHCLADHREQHHGSGDQAPAGVGSDLLLQVTVELLPVALPCRWLEVIRGPQGELGEASPVGALPEGG